MPSEVHVIPVPRGWSPEQAWEAISRDVLLTDQFPNWAVVEAEGKKMTKLLPIHVEAE